MRNWWLVFLGIRRFHVDWIFCESPLGCVLKNRWTWHLLKTTWGALKSSCKKLVRWCLLMNLFCPEKKKQPSKDTLPGDSIRDLLIPDRWRSRFHPLSSGHVTSPSQKGHGLNHQVGGGFNPFFFLENFPPRNLTDEDPSNLTMRIFFSKLIFPTNY